MLSIGDHSGITCGMADTKFCFVLDLNLIWIGITSIIYFIWDPMIGMMAFLSSMKYIILVNHINSLDKGENPLFGGNILKVWMALHALGWLTQFVGHGVYIYQ